MKINITKAKEEQERLSKEVILKDEFTKINFIGGTHEAYTNDSIISAITVMKYPSMETIESKYTKTKLETPYVSGFRSYREMPIIIKTYNKLKQKPDLLLVNGNGILHPRKFGIASHLGMVLNIPTIGVAKKLITGHINKGNVYIETEHLGFEFKTKESANPLFISPGYKISMGSSLRITKQCTKTPHKLPEPIHVAHKIAVKIKRD